jgi:hypothetical protein
VYFQISVSIAERHSEFQAEIEFIDSLLDEAASTSVYRADRLARINRMDVNRIESVLDLYTKDNALVCIQMIACEKCQTLARSIDIEEAIREHGVFDCSRCIRQLDQAGFHASDVIPAYYFQPESIKRVVEIVSTKTDRNPTVPIAITGQDQDETESDLSKNEAKI